MSKKASIVFSTLFFFLLLILMVSHIRVMDIRSDFKYQQNLSVAPIPAEMLIALSGEFKVVVSDFLFLEAANFVGGDFKFSDQRAWDNVARLLEQSSIMDPYFKQTYTFAQGILPWYAKKYDETQIILERSKDHRYWDWLPGFFIGFNHFYFFKDYLAASKALMEASKVPDAPESVTSWASRLASQAGRYQAAMEFLRAMYNGTEDERQKKSIEQRIAAISGAYRLQQAMDQFQKTYGRLPFSLDELVDSRIIKQLPEHPYGKSYFLKDGRVEF